MIRFFSIVIFLAITQISFGQVRATTESGNKVLLFDNGTWKYEEKTVARAIQPEVTAAIVSAPVEIQMFTIDSTREYETERTVIFYETSKTLERYFGEEEGRIRGSISCVNNLGAIKMRYLWEIPVGDGQRYVGPFKAGSKITVHLMDGKKVELQVGEDSLIESRPKYNFTAISGLTKAFTSDKLKALIAQPFRKLEVEWKKKNDLFEVEPSNYFMDTLPTIF